MKKILFIIAIMAGFIFAISAFAQTKFSVAEMARSSEAVVVATVAKIDQSAEVPQITVNVNSTLKGKAPKKLIISLLPDDAGGNDPKADAFKNGKQYMLFITQIEEGFAFLYQNLSGKLLVESPKWLDAHKQLLTGLTALDKSSSNEDRTKKVLNYLKSPHEVVQEMALTEIQVGSMQYNMSQLKGQIKQLIGSKNDDVRKRAIMALTRAYDTEATEATHGYSQDLELSKMLIDKLKDSNEEIRDFAYQQLRSHTRKDIEFDPKAAEKDRKNQVAEWEKWWTEEKIAKEKHGEK